MDDDDREALRRLVEEQGDAEAASRLVELAVHDGDVEALWFLVDAGNEEAADALAVLAGEEGDVATLKRLVDAGIDEAADQLTALAGATATRSCWSTSSTSGTRRRPTGGRRSPRSAGTPRPWPGSPTRAARSQPA